jgi:ComF family protein
MVGGANAFNCCRRCQQDRPCVSRARAIGVYDGALRAIVHALKYDARRSLAAPLGALMRARGDAVLRDAAYVVPVPLHPSRRRERGFNQARDLAGHLGLPVVEALARVHRTTPQAQLSAAGRRENVRDAFRTTRLVRRLIGATVVLVDDVSTTGATLDACAQTLKDAGIREVRALTAARVVGSAPVAVR